MIQQMVSLLCVYYTECIGQRGERPQSAGFCGGLTECVAKRTDRNSLRMYRFGNK